MSCRSRCLRRSLSICEGVANDAIECLETVFEPDLLPLAIGAAVIGDRDLVDAAGPRGLAVLPRNLERATLAVISGSKPKRWLFKLIP